MSRNGSSTSTLRVRSKTSGVTQSGLTGSLLEATLGGEVASVRAVAACLCSFVDGHQHPLAQRRQRGFELFRLRVVFRVQHAAYNGLGALQAPG